MDWAGAIVFRTARIAIIASSDVLSLRNMTYSFGVGLGLRRIGARSCEKRGKLYIDWLYETSGKRFVPEIRTEEGSGHNGGLRGGHSGGVHSDPCPANAPWKSR